ncbi:MAG TPA: AAA family ATPase [Candidatus Bathyarchaeia archaeon]|nr:AAA family ATPase [Candidatus Bathyarchaeia archaeon]
MMNIQDIQNLYAKLLTEFAKVIVGKPEILKFMMIALLSNGHILLEGVPGVAKTLMAKAFSKSLNLDFKRIQFTPDMLPGDVVGTFIFNAKSQDFTLRRGPIFANVILADEINRASPKTQSSLLEAMQERQVTIEGYTEQLQEPFIVLATQNPVELEGTYVLPESQLDRFMFRIIVDYPNHDEGVRILERALKGTDLPDINIVGSREEILTAREFVTKTIHVDGDILDYMVKIVESTRDKNSEIALGGSPKAAVHLLAAARASAALEGRNYVIPDDITSLVFPVLNHRIMLKTKFLTDANPLEDRFQYKALTQVLSEILAGISIPR